MQQTEFSLASEMDELPITLIRSYLSSQQQNLLIAEAQTYPWQQPDVRVFGKSHPIPRSQVWFGDEGCDTRYSGLQVLAQAWPYYATRLRQQLWNDFGADYNGVLVNRYANGQDCMGWHCDDEPEFQPNTDIASISLGVERDFVIKHKRTQQKQVLTLAGGDLLIMHFPMQENWLHSVPKRAGVDNVRYNFTFRQIRPHYFQR